MSDCTSVGACGLYCGSCPHYLARSHPELMARLAKTFNCREEEVACNGCRELTKACWGYHCKIRLCAENRGYAYCTQCPQLPCQKLKRLSAGYWDMPLQQLQELKGMGELSFLKLMGKGGPVPAAAPFPAPQISVTCGKEILRWVLAAKLLFFAQSRKPRKPGP